MSAVQIEIQRSLLHGFRRAQEIALGERRRGQRFEAMFTKAILGWWAGAESRIKPAQLVNISREGVLLLAAEVPREMERASFALAIDRESRWLPGTAVGSALDPSGRYLLRFRFDVPCPDEIFAIALGYSPAAGPSDTRSGQPTEPPSSSIHFAVDAEFDLSVRNLDIEFDVAQEPERAFPETAEFMCFDANSYRTGSKLPVA